MGDLHSQQTDARQYLACGQAGFGMICKALPDGLFRSNIFYGASAAGFDPTLRSKWLHLAAARKTAVNLRCLIAVNPVLFRGLPH